MRRRKARREKRRTGLTLLEALVSLGIILLLVSVVLPAVQRAREMARSARCLSNLRQIGIALHWYDASHQVWPSGWVLRDVWEPRDAGWGWLAMLLPHVGATPTYNALNFDLAVWSKANRTGREALLEVFLCPSDRYAGPVPYVMAVPGSGVPAATAPSTAPWLRSHVGSRFRTMYLVGPSSYLGVFGPRDPDDIAYQPRSEGTFFLNSAIGTQHLLDGTSGTAVVGERASFRLPGAWAGVDPREYEGPERVVVFGAHAPMDPRADEAEFSSRHPGYVNVLMGDGSARRISTSVDEAVIRALTTRAGGERISF